MRQIICAIALCMFVIAHACAQDDKPGASEAPLRTYSIKIVEFRLKASADHSMTPAIIAKDLEKLIVAGNVSYHETLRVSALESHPTSVVIGKTVSVVTGVNQGINGKTRSMTQRQIGTSMKATAESRKDKVFLKINYQATRIIGEAKEDIAPDMDTINVDTSLLLELGSPVVVAATSTAASTYILVTVSQ